MNYTNSTTQYNVKLEVFDYEQGYSDVVRTFDDLETARTYHNNVLRAINTKEIGSSAKFASAFVSDGYVSRVYSLERVETEMLINNGVPVLPVVQTVTFTRSWSHKFSFVLDGVTYQSTAFLVLYDFDSFKTVTVSGVTTFETQPDMFDYSPTPMQWTGIRPVNVNVKVSTSLYAFQVANVETVSEEKLIEAAMSQLPKAF